MVSNENRDGSITVSAKQRPYRIFISSPGDVPLERKLAREAINHISGERRFRGRLDIEIIAWDQPGAAVAMEAGLTPQQAISQGLPKPEECDLAVVILWSRMGTQLPDDFESKEDNTPYLSGTEWEYSNAINGFKRNGKPAVWIYRRQGAPNISLDDPDKENTFAQWEKLEHFFSSFTNPDGSLVGGINTYEAPDAFRQQFEHHLRDRLDKLLESLPVEETVASSTNTDIKSAPIWTESPYPGLQAFSPEQAPIFFGRGAEIDQLLEQFSDAKFRFVAVVGFSGSGKSSLVKAGLLPRLRNGIIGHKPWADCIIKPGERGGNPYLALAFDIKERLELSGQTEEEIARAMQADINLVQQHLTNVLAQKKPASQLLLVIDQFEELFTLSTAEDRNDFLVLLNHLVAQAHIRVIVTLRADFFARAIAEPILAKLLRKDRGTFPLDPPGVGAILQMIIRPAEAAGIELEEGLAQRLLDDAGEGPGAMALIAFTLNQLYQGEKQSALLSIKAYQAFGGVQGAVQKRAETALQGLPINLDHVLPKLFAHLVEVNEQEVATRSRAPKSLLVDDEKVVADALTKARLLVSGEGKGQQATLEVAHETVLTGWLRLEQWIREHAETLRARRDLKQVASEWDKSGRQASALRTGYLLQRYLGSAEPRSTISDDYLAACRRRRTGLRIAYSAVGLLILSTLGILFHVNKSHYPPTLAAKAMFVQLGILPVRLPKMVSIPAGSFEMGNLSNEGKCNEYPVRTVRFSDSFEMGIYEVTFDEYDLFAAATGLEKPYDQGWTYDGKKRRGDLPVINVSWHEAVAYASWLSDLTSLKYRLPTEAEWEYAARAESTTPYYWSETAAEACTYANIKDCYNANKNTDPVGSLTANKWGLHDMSGNVWEWNQDCYIDGYEKAPSDGSSQEAIDGNCSNRVLRGGSWEADAQSARTAFRNAYTPYDRAYNIGFRLARTH